MITTIAGQSKAGYSGDGGPATNASLFFPHDVAVDPAGNVYISDEGNNTIRMLQVAAPLISANGVVNAASYGAQISPGSLASVFAANITGSTASARRSPPARISGRLCQRQWSERANALRHLHASELSSALGNEPGHGHGDDSGEWSGQQLGNGAGSDSGAGPVFSYGSGRAVVQNQDFSLNSTSNPAKEGSTIMAYLTGSGPVDPPVADGNLTPFPPLF